MIFNVTRDNVETPRDLEKGDVVTFAYDDYSRRSLPVNPKVYRIRDDLSWEEVLENYAAENTGPESEGTSSIAHRI